MLASPTNMAKISKVGLCYDPPQLVIFTTNLERETRINIPCGADILAGDSEGAATKLGNIHSNLIDFQNKISRTQVRKMREDR